MLWCVGPRPGGPRSWAKILGLILKNRRKEPGPEGQGLEGKTTTSLPSAGPQWEEHKWLRDFRKRENMAGGASHVVGKDLRTVGASALREWKSVVVNVNGVVGCGAACP